MRASCKIFTFDPNNSVKHKHCAEFLRLLRVGKTNEHFIEILECVRWPSELLSKGSYYPSGREPRG